MADGTVTVRFNRDGPREGVSLSPELVYQASVDGGPRTEFRSPWNESELEELITILRNKDKDAKPDMATLGRIGRELAAAAYQIEGFAAKIADNPTVYWELDYAELANIPWELMTQNQEPFHHLLQTGTSFVRKVPAAVEDVTAAWPTGRNESLQLLYVWGTQRENDVPDKQHLEALSEICDKYDVTLKSTEIKNIGELTELCRDTKHHFVHILAHGARAADGDWGLRLREKVVSGAQVALALRSGNSTPALVTVSACDSANNENNTFGSVAYHLHAHGIPLVLASQFLLRKSVSIPSVATVYGKLLGGGDVIAVLDQIRRQLAPADNEGWANEVLYSRYRHQSLLDLSGLACQQAALRRARAIERAAGGDPDEAIKELLGESQKLWDLARGLESTAHPDRGALAETYGLLGSLQRRIARLRGHADKNDLVAAAKLYEKGFRADRNSHWCGINMIHLYKLAGKKKTAKKLTPIVRYGVEAEIERSKDFWAYASAGELEVYDGDAEAATDHYCNFVAELEAQLADKPKKIADCLGSSLRQLREIEAAFDDKEFEELRHAATEAKAVLESAVGRIAPS